jgi:hypothetical protein
MVDRLIFLFTKRATIWVGEAPAGKHVRRPASVVDIASMYNEIASKKLLTSNNLFKLNSLYAPPPVGPACHIHEI